ncbi:hypothetical protein DL93DRAFT_2092139 [Clavulina sp. PMI_390]|nr:hypothetical protein DL93DRAFT_2092139 [Clavulina sp. PMI_390]
MLSTPVTLILCVVLIGVAFGLEFALWRSYKRNGASDITILMKTSRCNRATAMI